MADQVVCLRNKIRSGCALGRCAVRRGIEKHTKRSWWRANRENKLWISMEWVHAESTHRLRDALESRRYIFALAKMSTDFWTGKTTGSGAEEANAQATLWSEDAQNDASNAEECRLTVWQCVWSVTRRKEASERERAPIIDLNLVWLGSRLIVYRYPLQLLACSVIAAEHCENPSAASL